VLSSVAYFVTDVKFFCVKLKNLIKLSYVETTNTLYEGSEIYNALTTDILIPEPLPYLICIIF